MFSGVGGSSTGATLAGVEIVAAFDRWKAAKHAYKTNFPSTTFFSGDIKNYSPRKLKAKLGDIDLILASPDCTSHSIAKGNARRSNESRNTAFQVIRFAKVFNPKWLVIENVERIGNWKRYREFIRRLRKIGYTVSADNILDAAQFGVPQARSRRFIICSRSADAIIICAPKARRRSVNPIIEQNGKYPYTDLRIERRAEATIAKADAAIKALGKKQPFIIVYYGSGKKGAGGWQRVSDPLRTITTLDRFAYVKPTNKGHQMRMLQPEELKLAMGFPKSFKLDSVNGITRRDRVKLMGNAVCPPVMEAIILAILHEQRKSQAQ